ncbi:CDP-diacylglycerol--serine O-phosphatidyltransferase [Candidatus Dependentiae bacterium]|nr:CDP-diacylglycerol--serine O-phosphatidyltransferase [Candidatus Dependentiae bacterium]
MTGIKFFEKISKKNCKNYLCLLPHIFTYLNALFGLMCILKTLDQDYFSASCYIFLAAFMDFLDGRIARALGSCSDFGMELDSLCDAISFCLAPAVLLYSCMVDVGRVGVVALAAYLCAGLFRLARFNSVLDKDIKKFTGLPTTLAALLIAILVMSGFQICNLYLYFFIAVIAILMISTIALPSFK